MIDKYVIHISVDGLTPHTITKLGKNKLPAFYKLREGGIFTNNARTDSITITLPNHTTMFTSLPSDTHNVKFNNNDTTQTIHNINDNKRILSIFSLKNIKNGLYVGKEKFMFLDSSYADGVDCIDKFFLDDSYKVSECFTGKTCVISRNGVSRFRDKCPVGWGYQLVQNNSLIPMDKHYVKDGKDNTLPIIKEFIKDFKNRSYNYYFIHFRGPDSVGHREGWDTPEYDSSVIGVDQDLCKVLDVVDRISEDDVYIILTSDHGGGGSDVRNHADFNHPLNFTIPFYVYRNKGYYDNLQERDLYRINQSRKEPQKDKNPEYNEDGQPIRNGDVGNLVAGIFGLGPIKGSTVGADMDLKIDIDS